MTMPITWWAQRNPYTKYTRCEVPARGIGGIVRDIDVVKMCGLDVTEVNEGVAVWQILVNSARATYAHALIRDGQPTFIEVDDNYTVFDPQYANMDWVAEMPKDPLTGSVELHRRLLPVMGGVIVSTPWLGEVYSQFNSNIHVCRNSIEPEDWPEPIARDDIFRIVWMASWSHRHTETMVHEALVWAAEQEGVEVYLFGPNLPVELGNIKRVPWTDDPLDFHASLVELRPDVGVCPIPLNDFSRAKSDLKAMSYAMAGALPIVTRFDPYEPWFEHDGDLCLVAESPAQDWMDRVQWCVENRDWVREAAQRARAHVLNERTITVERDAWHKAAESVRPAIAVA